MGEQLLSCYVLHRREYGNTSLLVEVFAADLGRFPALAKGARSARRSSVAAILQPFQPLLLACSGRGEVLTLTRIEPASKAIGLAGRALFCGFYVNELIMRLLGRNDPHLRLFAYYQETLAALRNPGDPNQVLRRFELRLLEETGYAMVLEEEAESGAPVDPRGHYRYDPERGPLRSHETQAGTGVSGRTLLDLARGRPLSGPAVREARLLLRQVLAHYLGEKPLKSRELFRI